MATDTLMYRYSKLQADGRTPVQVFKSMTGTKKFLLESTYTHEKKGKYSFLGMDPFGEVIGRDGETTIIDHVFEKAETKRMNALDYLKNHLPFIETDLPVPFFGGAVGYVGYDAIRDFLKIGEPLKDDLQLPTIHFMLFKDVIVLTIQMTRFI